MTAAKRNQLRAEATLNSDWEAANAMGVSKRTLALYKVESALAKALANLCKTDGDLEMVERLKNFTATAEDLHRAAEVLEFNGGATPLTEELRREAAKSRAN